jgi:hypothetical protein
MSDDQLDKEFKNRIKQVFDNYEDDTGAEGWTLLREKFPEKGSDRVVAWLWRYAGVAAILLAVLGTALWFNKKHTSNKNIVAKSNPHKTTAPVKIAASKALPDTSAANNAKTNIAYQAPAKPANAKPHILPSSANAKAAIKQQAHNKVNSVEHNSTIPATNNIAVIKQETNNAPKNANIMGTNSALTANTIVTKALPVSPSDNGNNNTIAATSQPANTNTRVIPFAANDTGKRIIATNSNPTPVKTNVTTSPKKPGMESLFANDSKYNTSQNNSSDVKIKNRKVVFGVYAATYVNYAKGSTNQFNTGAGFSSDIRLTQNLSIVTGVAIAQNSFSYNDITASSPVSFPSAVSATATFADNSKYALSQVVPPSRSLDASLVGLDVPVDLKYMFSPNTSSAYVSAGLSSGAFINETYNYTYSYNVDNNPTNQESQGATNRRTFNDFYFAKMLNVSFGMGYPLGKGNQLIIEPFLKYPLTGLGDQRILFGSGGLNLKLNFDAPKGKR